MKRKTAPLALVTGASSGIGEGTARLLAAKGYRLVLAARRQGRLKALARELGARALPLDVRDRGAGEAAERRGAFDGLDVLVNAAGLARGFSTIREGSTDDWDEMIDTNLKGLLHVTRAALPGMIRRGRGHVVLLGSTAGHWTYPKGGVYCATKYAVRALCEGLRMDLLGSGVRVTSVDPGLAETEFSVVRFRGDRARAKAVYAGMTPLTPADVAEAILWCLQRPPRVNIQQMVLTPTDQASVTLVHRRS